MASRNWREADDGGGVQGFVDEWVTFPGGELEGRRPSATCRNCQDRKALFRYRGVIKADRAHTLCFQCYRAELDRARARQLVDTKPLSVRGALLRFSSGQTDPKYAELDLRRRRAQIVARHAVDADLEYPYAWRPFVGYAKALG
jgi:hypothetical protein